MSKKFIDQEQINNIQKSVDIIDVISNYIPLTAKGKNFFGVCPFHPDHSPSMSVSKEKQIYKCFSCGASGNVFDFLINYENITFLEAVKKMADKAGIPININTKVNTDLDKTRTLKEIYNISHKFYKNNINTESGKKALEYIEQRKFPKEIIKEFEIGLSLKEEDTLTKLLLKKNYSEKDLLRTGLISKTSKGLKDTYMNRIMFPICNLNGELVGYSGRIYDSNSTSKYVNTKETEIFKKSEILYNYHKAKEEARKKDQVIVVEGFFALIRLHTIGIKNVVATLGTAFTKEHALILKRMAKEIILMFDGDSAGEIATNSCISELNKVGITPKIVRLEDKLDPDDYIIKYGKNKMIDKINNPMNIMDFKLNYHKNDKDLTSNEDLSKYVNEMLDELKNIDDDIYKELTLKKLADMSKISIEILRKKVNDNVVKEKPKIIKENTKLNKYEIAEQNLIYYMLNCKEIALKYEKEQVKFSNPTYEEIAIKIIDYLKKYNDVKISEILSYYRNDAIINDINELLNLNLKDNYKEEEIEDYIKVIKERKIKRNLNYLKNGLNKVQSKDEKKKLLEQMMKLRIKELEGEKQ